MTMETLRMRFVIISIALLLLSACKVETLHENRPEDLAKGDSCITIFYDLLAGREYDSLSQLFGNNVPKEELVAHLQLTEQRFGTIRRRATVEHFSTVRIVNGIEQSIDIRSKVRVERESGTTVDEIYLLGPDFRRWKVTGFRLNLEAQ